VYFNVKFNVFFKSIKVHLLVSELYMLLVCCVLSILKHFSVEMKSLSPCLILKYNCFIEGGGAHSRNNPYSCVCLHGDRKPPERKANLERFKNQEAKFLICTDVAARGLDITGLPFSKCIKFPHTV